MTGLAHDARPLSVILGGGFGGVYAALALEKLFLRDDTVEIELISEENFLLFTPMLPEVASGSLEAKHIISPIRAFFRKTRFHNSDVQRIDLDNRTVVTRHCLACGQHELRFDHLDAPEASVAVATPAAQ